MDEIPRCDECAMYLYAPKANQFEEINGKFLLRHDPEHAQADGTPVPLPCEICPKEHADLKDKDLTQVGQNLLNQYFEMKAVGPTEAERTDQALRDRFGFFEQSLEELRHARLANDIRGSDSSQIANALGG